MFPLRVNTLTALTLRFANSTSCIGPASDGITDFFVAGVTVYSCEENAIDFYILKVSSPLPRGQN